MRGHTGVNLGSYKQTFLRMITLLSKNNISNNHTPIGMWKQTNNKQKSVAGHFACRPDNLFFLSNLVGLGQKTQYGPDFMAKVKQTGK